MRHEFVKFEIKNAVIIFDQNAKKSCCNKKDVKLYKIWVAARKSDLQPVLEAAFNEEERKECKECKEHDAPRDVFEFCQAVPASIKVKRNLRLTGYDNPDEFYTFYVMKWNEPIDVTEDMLFQEVNLECFIKYDDFPVKDENGHYKRTSTGDYVKTPGGVFEMRKNHKITLVDSNDSTDSTKSEDKYVPAHDE